MTDIDLEKWKVALDTIVVYYKEDNFYRNMPLDHIERLELCVNKPKEVQKAFTWHKTPQPTPFWSKYCQGYENQLEGQIILEEVIVALSRLDDTQLSDWI
jgi:hypothetical protein